MAAVGLLTGLFISLVPTSPNFTDNPRVPAGVTVNCPADRSAAPVVVLLTSRATPLCAQWVAATDSVEEGIFAAAVGLLVAVLLLVVRNRRLDELAAKLRDNPRAATSDTAFRRLLNGGAVGAGVLVVSVLIGVLFVVGSSA
ncbi:MAG TPA: hypothetical protein VHX62_08665 [Solirubrobacteraceae bacterium]|nr:hypothetical protein [Solirubrobacteraceae bacterium]